ncbi:MAG: hypothetical protein KC457_00715 [Myxococcales bacterium]|nr:hypothetical protein [Myxococcales bacterium]
MRLLLEDRPPARLLELLIGLARMRLNPLRPIPEWQRVAANSLEAIGLSAAADGLRLSAELEAHHHLFLLDDLVQLHARAQIMGLPCAGLRELVMGEPSPEASEHARLRQLALCEGKEAALVVELELAQLGMVLGPALLDAWGWHFTGGADCLRWATARAADAYRRADERVSQVHEALARVPETRRNAAAHDWVRTAEEVIDSYLASMWVSELSLENRLDDGEGLFDG